jgi:hypothetical protein
MALTAPRIAIIVAITASIFGYLYNAPHSEGIEQMNRVRILAAITKTIDVTVCEALPVLSHNLF